MKMRIEHYTEIKEAIMSFDRNKLINHRKEIESIEYDKPKDIEKRIRWDYLWASQHHKLGKNWICDNLYVYLNDDHIDTALESMMKELSL